MIDSLAEQLEQRLDRASLTLVVTEPDERRFIPDPLIIGVVLFLIQRYAGAFLKGAGLEAMAERQGAAAAAFLSRLRGGQVTESDMAAARAQAQEV